MPQPASFRACSLTCRAFHFRIAVTRGHRYPKGTLRALAASKRDSVEAKSCCYLVALRRRAAFSGLDSILWQLAWLRASNLGLVIDLHMPCSVCNSGGAQPSAVFARSAHT